LRVSRVSKGVQDRVGVVTKEQVTVVAPKGEDRGFTTRIELPDRITAPVAKGQQLGFYRVFKDGRQVLSVPLVAGQDVNKANLLQQINKVFRGQW